MPTHLSASEIGPHSPSRRPIETLQPLAERLDDRYDIVWSSNRPETRSRVFAFGSYRNSFSRETDPT